MDTRSPQSKPVAKSGAMTFAVTTLVTVAFVAVLVVLAAHGVHSLHGLLDHLQGS